MIGAVIGRARMSKVDNEMVGGENNGNGYIPGDEQEENENSSGENDDIESYSKVRISNYIIIDCIALTIHTTYWYNYNIFIKPPIQHMIH